MTKSTGGRAVLGAKAPEPAVELAQRPRDDAEALDVDLDRAGGTGDLDALDLLPDHEVLELALGLHVHLRPAGLDLVQRRLRDVDVARVDEALHVPEQEGQDQRPDVRAVDVGVGHHDQPVVARLLEIEVLAGGGAERRHHGLHLGVAEHAVDARLLDVQDLAAQRQDGLELGVAAVDGRAAGGVALDQEQLGLARVLGAAVGELARQRGVAERALAGRVARLAGGEARPRGLHGLLDDDAALVGVLLEELGQLLVGGLLRRRRP